MLSCKCGSKSFKTLLEHKPTKSSVKECRVCHRMYEVTGKQRRDFTGGKIMTNIDALLYGKRWVGLIE